MPSAQERSLGTNSSAPEVRDSPRLGCVKYLNARPLIYGWPGEVRFDHPAVLCDLLAANQLDLALVSSFEYLRNPIYSIVDGVSIASHGPVYSVFVAHRGAIARKLVQHARELRGDENAEVFVACVFRDFARCVHSHVTQVLIEEYS